MRSAKDMPLTAASRGTRLVAVMPGVVFTSRMYGVPSSLRMKSARL